MAAIAQSPPLADYNIPAQDLSRALDTFAEISKLQLVHDANATSGKTSPGVVGRYTSEDALKRLLAGTGLASRMSAEGVVIFEVGRTSATSIGSVRVEGFGDSAGSPVNGVNGSSDVQATEGTGSYTTGAMSIVSKTPLSIKETPASVSVLTAQQIADQNITTLREGLDQLAGIAVVTNGNDLDFNIYSRGFQINSFEIDGGSPFTTSSGFKPLINLAEYDSIQLIRGADGTLNGYGDPSGVINLVRKKPLDHSQIIYEQNFASYNNFREVADITGPLAFDGKLRGRLVASETDNDYFYKVAHSENTSVYGILEYDLTPRTLLTIGGSYDRVSAIPNGGLPRYDDGGSIDFPVSTCLCSSFGRYKTNTYEAFLTLEHKFSENWATKLNVTYNKQRFTELAAGFSGPVDRASLEGEQAFATGDLIVPNRQISIDYTFNGAFNIFHRRQSFVVGGSYSRDNANNTTLYGSDTFSNGAASIPVDVFNFDPRSKDYIITRDPTNSTVSTLAESTQFGFYANVRLELLKGLHLLGGARYSGNNVKGLVISNLNFPPFFSGSFPTPVPPHRDHSVIPNAGLTYDILHNLTAYASYSGIYQPQSENTVAGYIPFVPVTGFNTEAGLKWQSTDKKFNASVAVYKIKQNNFLVFETDSSGNDIVDPNGNNIVSHSLENIRSKGFDFEAAGEVSPGWQISASYTYNDIKRSDEFPATATSSGSTVVAPFASASVAPHHLVKIWNTYHIQSASWLNRLTVGGGLQYLSAAFNAGNACASTGPADNANSFQCPNPSFPFLDPFNFTTKGYVTLALQAQYRINDHLDMSFTVNNLTDVKTYVTANGQSTNGGNWYLPPRSYRLTIKAKL